MNRKPTLSDAIVALGVDGGFSTDNGKITRWLTKKSRPSDEEVDAKLTELQAEWDALAYARNRVTEYPSVQELVGGLYDESDKEALVAKRAAVKLKYPKP